ncbi:hypothetical protein [Cupriavidus sp. RAF12]|uniref:hypothetical protein n=1 Tax=Cupriavidus sp. RAF12 TaxID=3233050 RepID=UPI003F928B04
MSKLKIADLTRMEKLDRAASRRVAGGIAYIRCGEPSPSWPGWPEWMPKIQIPGLPVVQGPYQDPRLQ